MPKQKVTTRRITVILRPPEVPIIDRMLDEGYEISEILRGLIRDWGKENFKKEPAYAEAARTRAQIAQAQSEVELAMKNMTNEEYAEQVLHGKVRDGIKVGFRVASGQEMFVPLAEIKQHTIESNGMIQVHNRLLDRTFIFPNGQVPTEAHYKQIFKGWDDEK